MNHTKYSVAAAVVVGSAILTIVAATALAGQRGPGTNVYIGEVFIIVDENIVSTTLEFDDTLRGLEFHGEGIKSHGWDLKGDRSFTFCANPDEKRTDQVKFKGYTELHIDTRGIAKVSVEGGFLLGVPKVRCKYNDKNGKVYETSLYLCPTRVTK